MTMSELRPSVIYRDGPVTADDYREAIAALEDALKQPEHRSDGCTICWDTDHFAERCHHNPLMVARDMIGIERASYWRCFHCDAVFAMHQRAEAEEHFGANEYATAACVAERTEELTPE